MKKFPVSRIPHIARERLALKARLVELGWGPMPMTPVELGKLIADDVAKWAKVIEFAGVKAQ